MTRKAFVALTYFLILLIGGVIGFALGNRHGIAGLISSPDAGMAAHPVLASNERLDAADATYQNSLRGYVSLLDSLTARDTSESARQIYAAEKALSLVRLADLADKRGESAESTRLTSDALAVCSTSGLGYCSSAELRQQAHRMDPPLESIRQSK